MPKISGTNLAEHRENTRDALFAALASLMREYSFEQISIAQISRRAGIGRTVFYNHYEDKESLLVALTLESTKRFTRTLGETLSIIDDPIQQLRVYIRAQLELRNQNHFSYPLRITSAVPQQQLKQHARTIQHIIYQLLNGAYEAGKTTQNPDASTVRLVLSCLSNIDLPANPQERSNVMACTEAFILRGLGAAESDINHIDPAVANLRFNFSILNNRDDDANQLDLAKQSAQARCPVTGAMHYKTAR